MSAFLHFEQPQLEAIIERLGWVLVHSLWQFALIALVAGIAARAMRRSTAAQRYGVLLVAMAAFTAAPVATWLLQPQVLPDDQASRSASATGLVPAGPVDLHPASPLLNNPLLVSDTQSEGTSAQLPPATGESVAPSAAAPPTAVSTEPAPPWSERFTATLRPWLAWIVAGWSLGVVLCSLRPLLGWRTLRRLQRIGVSPACDDILTALARVSARLGLVRAVRVMQSTLVRVPVVVGYLRPVILLPVSLVTTIPALQLDAILAHELAHIGRHDFLVNLLQMLVETLFFYHPAVWWLSHQIRLEREHCCDDLVVRLLDNRIAYGRALVAIEQLRGENSILALGASDGSLLARVRRIVGYGHGGYQSGSPRQSIRWPALCLGATCALLALIALRLGMEAGADQSTRAEFSAERNLGIERVRVARVHREIEVLSGLKSLQINCMTDSDAKLMMFELLQNRAHKGAGPNPVPDPIRSADFFMVKDAAAWPLISELTSLQQIGFSAGDLRGHISELSRLEHLREFRVATSKFDLDDLAMLKQHPLLEKIDVCLTIFEATDEAIAARVGELSADEQQWLDRWLAARPASSLNLRVAHAALLTDRVLPQLGGLTRLRSLRLINTNLTGRGLAALSEMRQLEELDANCLNFDLDAARLLANFPGLKSFQYVNVSDEVLAELTQLKNLEKLVLWGKGVTDAGARSLAKCTKLRQLTLRSSDITDAGLDELSQLPDLRHLELIYGAKKVTGAAVERFREQHPGCRLVLSQADNAKPARPERYVAQLPDGVKVNLVGVTRNTAPIGEGWTPGGQELHEESVWPSGTTISRTSNGTSIGGPGIPDVNARDLLVRINGLKSQPSLHIVGLEGAIGFGNLPLAEPYQNRLSILLNEPADVMNLTLALTDEPWGPWQQISPTGEPLNQLGDDAPYRSSYAKVQIQRVGPSRDDPNRKVLVRREPKERRDLYSFEIRAFDTDGRELYVHESLSGGVAGTDLLESESCLAQPLPEGKQLARYEYRLRPFRHWVTFKEVSLEPGKQTDVHVSVKSVPVESAQRRTTDSVGAKENESAASLPEAAKANQDAIARALREHEILTQLRAVPSVSVIADRAEYLSVFATRERNSASELERLAPPDPMRRLNLFSVKSGDAWRIIGMLGSLEQLSFGASDLRGHVADLAMLTELREFRAGNCQLEFDDLADFVHFPKLERLDLMFTVYDATDEALAARLGDLSADERHWLEGWLASRPANSPNLRAAHAALLTDRALARLGSLRRLKTLKLINTSVSDRGLAALADMPDLEELDVSCVKLDAKAARELARHPRLRSFRSASVSEDVLGELTPLVNLQRLSLGGKGITDAGVKSLSKCTKLQDLKLHGSDLTDIGLDALSQLADLRLLELKYGAEKVTPAGAARFRERLPNCQLVLSDGDRAKQTTNADKPQSDKRDRDGSSLPVSVTEPQPVAVGLPPEVGTGKRLELVQWSHDSKQVFAAGDINTLALWEHKESGWSATSLEADHHANSIAASRISPLIVAGTNVGTAEVWNASSRKRLGELRSSPQYSVYAVAISADDKLVAACGTDGTVAVFDRASQQLIARLGEKAATRMSSLAFSPDGKTLAAMDRYGQVVLWNLAGPTRLAEWKGIAGGEDCAVQWSPDGKQLAVSGPGRVTLIAAENGSQPNVVMAPEEVLSRYPKGDDSRPKSGPFPGGIKFASITAISPDVRIAASVSPDASIGIWGLATRKIIQKLPAPAQGVIVKDEVGRQLRNLALSPDGRRLACTTERGDVVFWQLASFENVGRGSPDPALNATEGLPKTDIGPAKPGAATGDLRSDERRGQETRAERTEQDPTRAAGDILELVRRFSPSIVAISKTDPKTGLPDPNPNGCAGVIVDRRGYILTMLWPTERGGKQLRVRLADQHEYLADVVATDANLKLAVLRVQARWPLPAVSLSKVRDPQSGDVVILIPSPGQKEAKTGIVTGLGIDLGENFAKNLIQSDLPLPITEGASLMVSDDGEPLGIWNAIRAGKTRASYAVPLNDALPFLKKALPPPAADGPGSVGRESSPVGRGSPAPAPSATEGLPKKDTDPAKPGTSPGNLRSDDRRGQETRAEQVATRAEQAATSAEQRQPKLGTLTGRFVYNGEPPVPAEVYPALAKLDANSPLEPRPEGPGIGMEEVYWDYLKHGIRPKVKNESLLIGKDRGVANVLIWVTSKNIPWSAPDGGLPPATITLKDGNYSPRIATVVVGQPLVVENLDPVEFDFAVEFWKALNPPIKAQLKPGIGAEPLRLAVRVPELFPAKYYSSICPWAGGSLSVHRNAYFAVSGPDGSFTLPNLPPGDWDFQVWHERAGFVTAWPKGQFKKTIAAGDNVLGTIQLKPEQLGQNPPPGSAAPVPKNREQVGEVLGKPVYRDQVPAGELDALFFVPVRKKYHDAHEAEFTPTLDEINYAAAYFDSEHRKQLEAQGEEAALRSRLEAIESQLSQGGLTDEAEQKLELEHSGLKARLKPPGSMLAGWALINWKGEKHIYDNFGGGRVLVGKFGHSAFDANRVWRETLEKQGEFKITDPTLRTKFYEPWKRDRGNFLHSDKEEIRRLLLEPEYVAPRATSD